MADPEAKAGVPATVTVNGRVTSRDNDAIVAQIERTREDLAATIDSIAERVSPANNMQKLRARTREQLSRPDVQLGAMAVGLALTGLVILRIWGRRKK